MSRFFLNICAFVLIIAFVGCGEANNKTIDLAYKVADRNADSALNMLKPLIWYKLNEKEQAKYALVYTIALDKNGFDVDNDSLLAIAYSYYKDRCNDSMYAKCLYYVGKYYMLNDSTEKAIECFAKSAKSAKETDDKITQCMALEKLSKERCRYSPMEALKEAKMADSLYATLPHHSMVNNVYHKLNMSMAYLIADSTKKAASVCRQALSMAYSTRDSVVIAIALQDMSTILREKGNMPKALDFAKKACQYADKPDKTNMTNLAWAYLASDSLNECNSILDSVKSGNSQWLYTYFYIKHLLALKKHDYQHASQYADTLSYYIEKIYGEELADKEKYYHSYVNAQYEREKSEDMLELL